MTRFVVQILILIRISSLDNSSSSDPNVEQGQNSASMKMKKMTSLTFLINLCGRVGSNREEFERILTNDKRPHGSSNITMQDLIEKCSYDKVSFTSTDNIVIDALDLGCNLESDGFCDEGDYSGPRRLAKEAEDYVREQEIIDIDKYDRHIFILPSLTNCRWVGLGNIGCSQGSCNVWINDGKADMRTLGILWHEVGHTMGLHHSGIPGNEYGDCTCGMGNCGIGQCFNAAQSWNLGWALPIDELSEANMLPGRWLKYFIPALQVESSRYSLYEQNNLIVRSSQAKNTTNSPAFFLSFRIAENSDQMMSLEYANHVYIHYYDVEHVAFDAGKSVTLLSALDVNEEFTTSEVTGLEADIDSKMKFIVHFIDIQGSFAEVKLCRWLLTDRECSNSRDIVDMSPSCQVNKSKNEITNEEIDHLDVRWKYSQEWKNGICYTQRSSHPEKKRTTMSLSWREGETVSIFVSFLFGVFIIMFAMMM